MNHASHETPGRHEGMMVIKQKIPKTINGMMVIPNTEDDYQKRRLRSKNTNTRQKRNGNK